VSQVAPRDALSVYPPQKRYAIVRNRFARTGVALGIGAPANEPPVPFEAILGRLGVRRNGLAAMRSSRGGRWILGIERFGGLAFVAKCGSLTDDSLRNEATMLGLLARCQPGFLVPELVFADEIEGAFVVVVRSAGRNRRPARFDLERAATIATTLTLGVDPVGPVVHGDFAEWNLIGSNSDVTLVDWEASRKERAPLWDLSHYVVQHAALVRGTRTTDVVRILTGPGSVGARHLAEVGEAVEAAPDFLRSYLARASKRDAAATFRAELSKILG
jgi:hypothetical protein